MIAAPLAKCANQTEHGDRSELFSRNRMMIVYEDVWQRIRSMREKN